MQITINYHIEILSVLEHLKQACGGDYVFHERISLLHNWC